MLASKERKSFIIRAIIILCALTFLYLPIVTLIVYSFNESRMVTVWTQTSLKWYRELFQDGAIGHAVGISLLVAITTAMSSVVIGTLAAFVLVRVGRFKGESLFVLLMTAPMVLPEVITGLALLLIFVTFSDIPVFADRGVFAIWIAHVTFTSAYTTVVIRSRFRELDISIEEAAMDLGAGPVKVFFAIILPALMPSEVAAFLLAFTMSMDDLVITSFIAGPDSTTLPMLIFSSVRRGLSPEINALATIIVFIVSIFTFFAWLSMVKKQKRMRADAAKAARATEIEQNLHYLAPHGGEILDPSAKLSDAHLALLKEQAAALNSGRDIADETASKVRSLLGISESLMPPVAIATDVSAEPAAANAAAAASTGPAQFVSSHNIASEGTDEANALGNSARAMTAASRVNSSSLVAQGQAKVLESKEMKLDYDDQPLDELKINPDATTKSSLESAKAKKAAIKSAMSHVIEQSVKETESALANKDTVETTQSSLVSAKAKKNARAQNKEDSAMAITRTMDKSTLEKAKVLDETKK